ncbi:hypothetical protein ElyMa_004639800 [Elysia marginata]|uniref:Uncharacterized protein n=1 Tax=Elysia marginata TaxID=1093978 RepID=A0AAV4I4Z9_9GAST|nr:hypothetical protein ElyMa_004639800 [Elysia marginata]
MVVTDSAPLVTRIKVEPPDSCSSDTDTTDATDNSSSCPSGRSTPVVTPPSPSSHAQQQPLPMDTVILVAKSKDGSKNSLVFRSLLRNRRTAPGRVEKIRIIKTGTELVAKSYLTWPRFLSNAVRERVLMTENDSSLPGVTN